MIADLRKLTFCKMKFLRVVKLTEICRDKDLCSILHKHQLSFPRNLNMLRKYLYAKRVTRHILQVQDVTPEMSDVTLSANFFLKRNSLNKLDSSPSKHKLTLILNLVN